MVVINKIMNILRDNAKKYRVSKLENKDFSIISNNCCGSLIYKLLGMRFTSPTIGIIIDKKEFFEFCYHLCEYCAIDMEDLNDDENDNKKYDSIAGILRGKNGLRDIIAYFPHETDSKQAINNWNKRRLRINYENIFIIYDTHMYITNDDFGNFDRIPYKNKVIFVEKNKGLNNPNAFEFNCYKKETYNGAILFKEIFKFNSIYTNMDEFDFVHWLNTSIVKPNSLIRKN